VFHLRAGLTAAQGRARNQKDIQMSTPVTENGQAHMSAEHEAHAADTEASPILERGPELAVSALLLGVAALVISDSLRLGHGWSDDGPQSGYFPFYIGLMLAGSSGVVLLRALSSWMQPKSVAAVFAQRHELRLVMAMLVPAVLYVGAIAWLGIYVASLLLIAYFMRRHGRFGWPLCAAVAAGVPLTFFFVFERWFLVALPKGPIERLLGL